MLQVFCGGTAFGLLVAAALLFRYPITRERQQQVRSALLARSSAISVDAEAEADVETDEETGKEGPAQSSGQGPGSS